MVKLSLIIPHWNTYELMRKLMLELSIQKNDQVEIIVIDDSNEKRLDEFKNIATIVHRAERAGLSSARNYGLELSTGQFIGFIDSDDMITNDYVGVLLDAIENRTEDQLTFNWADFNENIITRKPQNPAVWKSIYRRNIVPKFNESVKYNEDVFFQEELRKNAHNEYFIDRVLYIYNSNRIGSLYWERNNQK